MDKTDSLKEMGVVGEKDRGRREMTEIEGKWKI